MKAEAHNEAKAPLRPDYHIFRTIKYTVYPQIWEENRGVSYSLNVAYLACYRISTLKDVI